MVLKIQYPTVELFTTKILVQVKNQLKHMNEKMVTRWDGILYQIKKIEKNADILIGRDRTQRSSKYIEKF